MRRLLTILALAGIGVVAYNAYKTMKASKKTKIKTDLE